MLYVKSIFFNARAIQLDNRVNPPGVEECDYDNTLTDDSRQQGGDKKNRSVGEDNSNMCKDVVIQRQT